MNKQEILKELESAITDHNVLELIAERIYNKVVSKVDEPVKPVKRWRAEEGNKYYYLDNIGEYHRRIEEGHRTDDYHYSSGNYFQTQQEAIDYKRRTLIRQQIADIALELNDGEEIYWNDNQVKYGIIVRGYNISCYTAYNDLEPESSYCLSENYLQVVKKRLSDDDFKFYYGISK
jgi:hypothetical protein